MKHRKLIHCNFSRERIEHEILLVQMTMENWDATHDDEKIEKLSQIIQLISTRIKDLRFLFQKQKLALQKFQREAGEDWRNSRFVYAISSVQAMIYQIQIIVKRLLSINNSLLQLGAYVQNSSQMFIDGCKVDSFTQENWISLKDPDDLPETHKGNMAFTKQRSHEWFERRSNFKITEK